MQRDLTLNNCDLPKTVSEFSIAILSCLSFFKCCKFKHNFFVIDCGYQSLYAWLMFMLMYGCMLCSKGYSIKSVTTLCNKMGRTIREVEACKCSFLSQVNQFVCVQESTKCSLWQDNIFSLLKFSMCFIMAHFYTSEQIT